MPTAAAPLAICVVLTTTGWTEGSEAQGPAYPSGKGEDGGRERARSTDNEEDQGLISQAELQQLNLGYADRYMTYLASAADKIEEGNSDPKQRRRAHQVKLAQVSAIYDIVTNPDPFTQLLDLTLVVTLQSRKWIDDNQAANWFGDRGRHLVSASRQARLEIWKIAARVMRTSQLEQLDTLILDWHRKHPNVDEVSYVRFDDFASSRSKSIVAEVAEGGGFLAPIGEATKAVDELRALAERALFLGKRMPFLLDWQVRNTVSDALTGPELGTTVPSLTASIDRATRTMQRLPQDVERQREQVDALISKHSPMVSQMLGQSRLLVNDANALASSSTSLIGSVESMLARLDQTSVALRGTVQAVDEAFLKPSREKPDPNAKPFDIAEYTRTASAFGEAIGRTQALVTDLKTTLSTPAQLQDLNDGISASLTTVRDHSRQLIDLIFWRLAALMVLAFVLLILYRLLTRSTRVRANSAAADADKLRQQVTTSGPGELRQQATTASADELRQHSTRADGAAR